mmetsp:Transcript_11213/g.35613  ORF Transcript_11213/g.35613 Transcript_11213/m.35613 type:complete len:213 (+) Transcript_11213:1582-2220(+)
MSPSSKKSMESVAVMGNASSPDGSYLSWISTGVAASSDSVSSDEVAAESTVAGIEGSRGAGSGVGSRGAGWTWSSASDFLLEGSAQNAFNSRSSTSFLEQPRSLAANAKQCETLFIISHTYRFCEADRKNAPWSVLRHIAHLWSQLQSTAGLLQPLPAGWFRRVQIWVPAAATNTAIQDGISTLFIAQFSWMATARSRYRANRSKSQNRLSY